MVDNGQHVVEEALAAQDRGEPYDVILMTMKMPEMDGYEATARLRHKGYRRPILALIGDPRDQARCQKVGCDAHLLRPIEREPLLRAIQEHTQRKLASLPDLPAPAAPPPEAAVAPWAHQHSPSVQAAPEPPTVELPVVLPGGASLSRWAQDPEMQPLLALFAAQLPERLTELEAAFAERAHDEVRAAAHRLKGSAGSYGFDELARLAGVLTQQAHARAPWPALEPSLEALRAEVQRITWVAAPADGATSWSDAP
jgi:CheY-like chemotaxis protein/HPt (histidine-containing phosphotransfer) domain-containing protein